MFISTAYSTGSSLETLSAKPLTIRARASSSRQAAAHEIEHGFIADLPMRASWPMAASFVRTSIAGMVSERDSGVQHQRLTDTEDLAPLAVFSTTTLLRNVLMPPLLLIERVFI